MWIYPATGMKPIAILAMALLALCDPRIDKVFAEQHLTIQSSQPYWLSLSEGVRALDYGPALPDYSRQIVWYSGVRTQFLRDLTTKQIFPRQEPCVPDVRLTRPDDDFGSAEYRLIPLPPWPAKDFLIHRKGR